MYQNNVLLQCVKIFVQCFRQLMVVKNTYNNFAVLISAINV